MTHTFIPGKDAALETSLDTLKGHIEGLGFTIVEARWLNPAPYIWSVHIRDRDCPQVFANGKGATRKAALASAYGEMLERLATRYLWADFYLTPAQQHFPFIHQAEEQWFAPETPLADVLDAVFYQRYGDDLTLAELSDMNGGDSGRGICTLPYVRQRDGKTVNVPVNLIGNMFVSNGMSAGNTRDEGQVQGLSEIFERAIKERIIRDAITLPEIPADVLGRYPHIQQGIAALEDSGFQLRALDASLGGTYPVISVVLLNPDDGGLYACFGAHPRFEVALERALTELVQGRALDELGGFPPPTADMDLVTDPHNLELHFIDASGYVSWALLGETPDVAFSDWDDTRSNAEQRESLIALLHDEGHEVYIAEHTELGAYASRILVPGFSDIYLPDELKWHNNNQAVPHRATLFTLAQAGEAAWQALLACLEDNNVNDQMSVLEWAGIVPDPDTAWERLRVGELKLWLLLALGEQDAALEQLSMVRASGNLVAEDERRFSALASVLELTVAGEALDDYARALAFYHGNAFAEARALTCGETVFPGLDAMDPDAPTVGHKRLLEGYAKVLKGQQRAAGG
ncbi:30S ribosomal protein S12 methylthiotransferase accessory factor YcaO [Halomonas cibimaris]|uniref:30S ribosomal protein S12 methylthiotransferase accessory factor YcaO n=1 Tax=Halomonas cibimaris TaxID=657012 RepID=A0ABP7LVA6_9GAMM